MKRIGLITILTAGILRLASAQSINISGTVKTKDGDALHLAFVQDKQYKNGVYTDSLGTFALSVNPNSKLKVTCFGFRDTVLDINNQIAFKIVMQPLVNIVAKRSNITPQADDHNNINFAAAAAMMSRDEPSLPNTKQTYTYTPSASRGPVTVTLNSGSYDMGQGAIFPSFVHKEATQGSRYLFDDWVHGYVVNAGDSTIQSPLLFFNYDKMGGSLLLTKDKRAAIEVYKDNVKIFTLFDPLNQPYTFTMVPQIDKSHYVQVLSSGNNYKIYKTLTTKFVASNYVSDGIASSGNNFDSYQDESTYYILNVKTNQLQKIGLKKKVLKQAFGLDEAKAGGYFKTNDADVDDNYLAALGDYMNK
jgi:hypothetical protein